MLSLKKMIGLTLIAVAISSLSFAIPTHAGNDELNLKAKTLQFLSDVVRLDLSKYEVTLQSDMISPYSGPGGTSREEIRYNINTSNSVLDAMCDYVNGKFSFCMLDWRSGKPVYTQPQPASPADFAEAVLERFQNYVGNSRYQPIVEMLNTLRQTEATTAASGSFNLTETIRNSGNSVNFLWKYSAYEAEANAMELVINNGSLYSVNDATAFFSISNMPAIISEQQAVNIALESAYNFSWTTNGKQYRVQAPISPDLIQTDKILNTVPPRDASILYPLWTTTIWFGKIIGGDDHMLVGVWADTGEVAYVQAAGSGGIIAPSYTPLDKNSSISETLSSGIAVIGIIAIIAVTWLSLSRFKKKHK
jgi:hypothetical protein